MMLTQTGLAARYAALADAALDVDPSRALWFLAQRRRLLATPRASATPSFLRDHAELIVASEATYGAGLRHGVALG